ncbi:hypothetical protein [Flexivirga caeni]|uniref:Uncharacterized protein n=1 Tax=Flexivirga caeni TaxID=2294115 RepID=A0A3M9MI44_9MICO|nr:hypothetical protein [Flexivirga caeni]RNI25239.1 hypothetical protein EFY87_00960 [Flexivirga caeni]
MVDWPSGYVPGVVEHHDQWRWNLPYEHYARLLEVSAALREVVAAHWQHWHRALSKVRDGGTALVVSSGGSIEPVLVFAFAAGRFAEWGSALHHLDGATLVFREDTRIDLEIRRRWSR